MKVSPIGIKINSSPVHPHEMLKLQKNLIRIANGENIGFVYGKEKAKPQLQQLYEELEDCGKHLMGYKESFEIMGKGWNSDMLEEVTADSDYCSEKNLLYLKENHISSITVTN